MSRRRHGFTLIEVLVAATLISVVMAMAMQAFMGMGRLSDVSKSRLVAGSEANKGIRELAGLLRRAHVIYFTGRPFANQAGNAIGLNTDAGVAATPGTLRTYANDPATQAIPDNLGASGPFPGPDLRYNFTDPTQPVFAGGYTSVRQGRFRFFDWTGANANTLGGGLRLRSMETPLPAGADAEVDQFFTSPLMYIGEIDFAQDRDATGNTDGAIVNMFQPLSWTFHVVYLAPMNVSGAANETQLPSWVSTNRASDRAAGGWRRSVIPFELRVYTIPNVDATTEGQRFVAQRTDLGPHVKGAPFDYMPNTINYDPIAIQSREGAGDFLNPAGSTKFNGQPAAGRRVNGGMHTNFNNIGNDPPTNAALAIRTRDAAGNLLPIRDRSIAQYVDPDSVHGTCVRLLNTIGAGQGTIALAENSGGHNPGQYRRYLNAYGGEFLYNHYRAFLPALTPWDNANGAPVPQRAFISVATRYRTTRQVKFQFAVESMEIDLENVVKYQNLPRRSR